MAWNPTYYQHGAQQRYVFQWHGGQGGVFPAQQFQARAPTSSSLGMADMLEGGYGDPNFEFNYPAFNKVAPKRYCPPPPAPCGLRAKAAAELDSLGAAHGEYGSNVLSQIGLSIVGGIKNTFGGHTGGGATTLGPKPMHGMTLGPRGRHYNGVGDWPLARPQGFEPGWAATGAIPIWDGLSQNEKTIALVALGAGALWWLTRKKKRRNPWKVTARSRGVTGSLIFRTKKGAKEYAAYLARGKKRSKIRRVK